MSLSRIQMLWTWVLSACLTWMCISQAAAATIPQYMVTIPAVIEAGSETMFCVDFMQPCNKNYTITITIVSSDMNITLFQRTTNQSFHHRELFQPRAVQKELVLSLEVVVVQGQTLLSKEVRKIMFKSYKPMTFIRTDKPIYLPGQTVKFRIFTMDTKFTPINELYKIVEIEDAHGNRIGQWENQISNGTILEHSYPLNPEAHEGIYRVIVHVNDIEMDHYFKVEKYVLPRFDVKLEAHDKISIEQEEFTAEVCALYTYGRPVPGMIEVDLCRPIDRFSMAVPDMTVPCHKESKRTLDTGCATFTFNMSTFTTPAQTSLDDKLQLNAKVEEDGTGIALHAQEKVISLSYCIGYFIFTDTPVVYKENSVIRGTIKAYSLNHALIPNMVVYLFVGKVRSTAQKIMTLRTCGSGEAKFSFNASDSQAAPGQDIFLTASAMPELQYHKYRVPHFEDGEHVLSLVQEATVDTKTMSSLEVKWTGNPLICRGENDITIHYTVVGEPAGPVELMYLILSRGAIRDRGLVTIDVLNSSVTDGEIAFKLEVTPVMAPFVQVLVYTVLPSEAVIAHSADFITEKCFSNQVFLEFSPSTAIPGEKNTLQVSAMSGSLCGVGAIDKSVHIKQPGKRLDADKIFDRLPVKAAYYIPYELDDFVPVPCLPVRRQKRDVLMLNRRRDARRDAFTVFMNLGLKMATNLVIKAPSCVVYKGREYYKGFPIQMLKGTGASGGLVPVPYASTGSSIQTTIRSFFPETWIWDLVAVGDSGKADVSLTVPDTITTWETEAFCLSSSGFGLAPPKELKVFQPFFLELSLPYSIVRGERFVLKATVFNYQSSCIMVSVTPSPSSDYTLTAIPGEEYASCVCANGRKTFNWTMDASVLGVVNVTVRAEAVVSNVSCNGESVTVPERGRVDVVTRSLIIKAEGTEVFKAYNWLMCPKGCMGETLTETIQLQLPDNVIMGSVSCSISVLGDILGRALKNPAGMLRMPYGCGEQNMARFAPNIYVLEYLDNTNQMTPAVTEKAMPFLVSGYQRQLLFKHSNGAYSTFGTGQEHTWLTAFVLRTLVAGKSFYNSLDQLRIQSTIEQARIYLYGKRRPDGCFEQSGKLFNNRMKGGVSDEVTLSAYITASFLEMNMPSDHVVKDSLSCLRDAVNMSMETNTYTTALLAYVFSLARDETASSLLLQHLDKIAVTDGDSLHWSQTSDDTSASLSVEISSYVLLAKLVNPEPSAEDLGYAARIVRWLARQQNSYGGFSSTQDTVVAFQALARFATVAVTQEHSDHAQASSTVTVRSPSVAEIPSVVEIFTVDKTNRLLYQERPLHVMEMYILEVKGTQCVSAQVSLNYNIPTPVEKGSLSITVTPEADCSSHSTTKTMTLNLQSLYTGNEPTTNMVLVDITMLSGFIPHPESLKKLKKAPLVDLVEEKDDHVIMYLTELTQGIPVNHTLMLVYNIEVLKLKPALVKIYDYYQPSDNMEKDYMYPCQCKGP